MTVHPQQFHFLDRFAIRAYVLHETLFQKPTEMDHLRRYGLIHREEQRKSAMTIMISNGSRPKMVRQRVQVSLFVTFPQYKVEALTTRKKYIIRWLITIAFSPQY